MFGTVVIGIIKRKMGNNKKSPKLYRAFFHQFILKDRPY